MEHAWEPQCCMFVCAVTDDSPTSDETGPAAKGVCSIGILCVLFVNVFPAVEELLWRNSWKGLKQERFTLRSLSWLLYAALFGWKNMGEVDLFI